MKRKFRDLIKLSNSMLKEYQERILEYTKDVDPKYVWSESIVFYNKCRIPECISRSGKSKKEFYEWLVRKSENIHVEYEKIVTKLEDLKNKVYSHRNSFYDFVTNFVSGFVTLRKISNNEKTYLFAENIQTIVGGEQYVLNGISTKYAGTTSVEIDPRVYIISKMTDIEFEEEYFPSRIRNCGITSEVELGKYGVELNEFFYKH